MHRLVMILALGLTAAAVAAPHPDAFDPAVVGPSADLAHGFGTEHPEVAAVRVPNGSVALDGLLDDGAWERAPLAGGFTMMEPERGGRSSQVTTFKVVYDDRAVYFGVACFETDPALTSSTLARRDNMRNSDLVSIYIDPYLDRASGYNFRVNPHGVLADAQVANQWNRDWNWDAVWDARTHRDARGWYAEIAIPFSSIRYRPGDGRAWGLQVYRWMHGRGEDSGWVSWPRDADDTGFFAHFGTLTGLDGLEATRALHVTPYVLGGVTNAQLPGADPLDGYHNSGLDLKYAVTADLTLNATFLPDFAQVEADPAVLNLSPFETSYEERRPFFVEGSQDFAFRGWNLFYSRRIGTGRENARIRGAAKLTGKTRGDVTVAALVASTDATRDGQGWNPLKGGLHRTDYGVLRVGRESADGARRFHVMQTLVVRDPADPRPDDDPRDHRNAAVTGVDGEWNVLDRAWKVEASAVRTAVTPHGNVRPGARAEVGSAGLLSVSRNAGKLTGGGGYAWEHDRFDPNDAGLLFSPDERNANGWLAWRIDTDGSRSWFNRGLVRVEMRRSWLYAGHTGRDPDSGEVLWSFGPGHDQGTYQEALLQLQTRLFWNLALIGYRSYDNTSRWLTRSYQGRRGPLISAPDDKGLLVAVQTDWRKDFIVELEAQYEEGSTGGDFLQLGLNVDWIQSDRLTHGLELEFTDSNYDTQWLGNYAWDEGIGGVAYVFAPIHRRTWELTWRASALFDRDRSLELYLQPFLTVGSYGGAKALARPDSYDFVPYDAPGFAARDFDFSYAAVNLNLVYRWEYRPGSLFFLVWTHGREAYDQRRMFPDGGFRNDFGTDRFLRDEPRNVLLTKLTYLFSL